MSETQPQAPWPDDLPPEQSTPLPPEPVSEPEDEPTHEPVDLMPPDDAEA
jgi:hypothetical protein